MKIFEVVIGSNHFLIQAQTVGKKAGAPIIYSSSQHYTLAGCKRVEEKDIQISYQASRGSVQ